METDASYFSMVNMRDHVLRYSTYYTVNTCLYMVFGQGHCSLRFCARRTCYRWVYMYSQTRRTNRKLRERPSPGCEAIAKTPFTSMNLDMQTHDIVYLQSIVASRQSTPKNNLR